MSKIRCAIYTRKSSEEGLEQDFNSLDAQREACAAYIVSQASEGWSLMPGEYDDGGLSGGTLERPALKRLLADIAAGEIDTVLVYKVDRLTRSLLDFAKLVEAFDNAGTSFVSVTQSFNTTSSMGRLTLNMLLSFAQFEREVTAERIRDKIAASKAKGMWMGGNTPLGYKPEGRTLVIIEDHADVIRDLFRRYLRIGNVRLLAEELAAEDISVPARSASTGRQMGGGSFSRGQIYKILSNPVYLGEIRHKDRTYQGKHQAIIDRELWDQVQTCLADNTQGQQRGASAKAPSLLAGRAFDESGEPLVAAHACKGKVRYRYYVSRSLQHDANANTARGIRIPALELEKTVGEGAAKLFDDPLGLMERASLKVGPNQIEQLATSASRIAARLRKRERKCMCAMVSTVVVERDRITIHLSAMEVAERLGMDIAPGATETIPIAIDASIRRTGLAVRLVHENGRAATLGEPQDQLVRLLAKARSWWSELAENSITASDIARRHDVTPSYASRVLRLNFLAPDLVRMIMAGEQPAALNVRTLLALYDLPHAWDKQKRELHVG